MPVQIKPVNVEPVNVEQVNVEQVDVQQVTVQLERVQAYAADGQFGHRFTLRLAIPQRSGARLNWIERTGRPCVAGMAPDTWTDLYRLIGDTSQVFADWIASEDDEGPVVVTVVDPPSIQ